MWNLILFRLEIVLVAVQDRCTICVERTIDTESFWMPTMVLQGDEAQVKARFSPFGDSVNLQRKLDARFALNVP
jgi:hypothetical protein